MSSLFLHSLHLWPPLSCILLFLGMMLGGEEILFTVGFLVHERMLPLAPTLGCVTLGVLIGDLLWFQAGRWIVRKHPRLARRVRRLAAAVERPLRERPWASIVISKFLYGMNHITLLGAGVLGVDRKTLIRTDLGATAAWIPIIGGLGYAAGASFSLVRHHVRFIEIGLAAGVLLLLGTEYLFRKWYHSRQRGPDQTTEGK